MKKGARRVLFVDDDRAIHRAVAHMLRAFEVSSAYDGPTALALLLCADRLAKLMPDGT